MLEVKEGGNKSHLVPTSPSPIPTPQPRWLPQHLWPCCLLASWPLTQWAAFGKLTKAICEHRPCIFSLPFLLSPPGLASAPLPSAPIKINIHLTGFP